MKKAFFLLSILICYFSPLSAQRAYTIARPDGITLYTHEYGTGKPVVLLGGGPGLNPNYLVPLSGNVRGYRFIIPDQRGAGQSVMHHVDSINMAVDKYVEDLEALRVHLKLTTLVIAGHSWGGMLALAYAAKYPAHVERLVLLGSGGITARFFTYFDSNITMRLHPEDLEEAHHATGTAAYLRGIWPGYFFSRERALATKHLLDSTVANRNQSDIYRLTIHNYEATATARMKNIRNYKNPITIIQGRQDPIGESTVYEICTTLPHAKFTFIEESGHFPWLESEKSVAEFYRLLNAAL